jgi:hypothetical protein
MSSTSLRAPLALALAATAACFPNQGGPKGEQNLGDFSFVAVALEDSCLSSRFGGSMTFQANLSRTKEILFFGGPGGTVRGAITGATFTVTFGGSEEIDRYCTVVREETLSGTLEGSTLTGTFLIRVIPVQGANCLAAVAGANRQFATLPCFVRYQVNAQRTDTPDAGPPDAGLPDGGAADGGV